MMSNIKTILRNWLANDLEIRFAYMVPADRDARATAAIEQAVVSFRYWLRQQMNGKTFQSWTPTVHVWQSNKAASWFSTNPNGDDPRGYYWLNSLQEAYSFGASWTDGNSYVIFVDAPIGANQYAGGTGGISGGIAVLHGKDCASVMGIDPDWTQCRGIGGMGHETLHTRGIPHPVGDPDWSRALMGTGYTIFPECILTQQTKDLLNIDPILQPRSAALPGVCKTPSRSTPLPRPHPIPTARP